VPRPPDLKIPTHTSTGLDSSAQTAPRSRCIGPCARNGIFAARDRALKSARPRRQRPNTENRASQKARKCGSFSQGLRDRQIEGLRGGPGRTRTSNQTVMAAAVSDSPLTAEGLSRACCRQPAAPRADRSTPGHADAMQIISFCMAPASGV
jgi:hypothetical protein